LLPVLPELVLAVGAMALLMLGAYRGEGTTRSSPALRWCAGRHWRAELMLPAAAHDLRRQLHRRRLCALPEDPHYRFGGDADPVGEFLSDPSRRIFEYSILVLLHLGMMVLISPAT
jgi:NADH-quinone oxidoreductase subunit N